MNSSVSLLDASLLRNRDRLAELTRWLRIMNRPNGWHYDLDHIWILDELEKAGIRPGAVIVDAGAGQGVMQYLLAARGYQVISLDFSPRTPPPRSRGIFSITGDGDERIAYEHPYMKFMSYSSPTGNWVHRLTKLRKLPQLPGRLLRWMRSYLYYLHERFLRSHDGYGTIRYVRAPFHDVPLESGIADAVISVSAIEHADIGLFSANIGSLVRLLKPGAPLLLTTSATDEASDRYDKKVEGWCFSRPTLAAFFPGAEFQFDPTGCRESLKSSTLFRDRIDPYYHLDPESPFYRRATDNVPYLPLAVKMVR